MPAGRRSRVTTCNIQPRDRVADLGDPLQNVQKQPGQADIGGMTLQRGTHGPSSRSYSWSSLWLIMMKIIIMNLLIIHPAGLSAAGLGLQIAPFEGAHLG
ncbi:hypothetical protein XOCp0044 (plasmid) [Xanthomonas oryzae pv. oryzicola]|nr:hypothetical protein XOCp0044 [Xanthomonas oryzae pv. oryzicola]